MEESNIVSIAEEESAFFNGEPVNIHGGYKSASKGHCVEITNNNGGFSVNGKQMKRISVSFWGLEFSSHETAEKIFISCFGYAPTKRRCRDYRKSGQIKVAQKN